MKIHTPKRLALSMGFALLASSSLMTVALADTPGGTTAADGTTSTSTAAGSGEASAGQGTLPVTLGTVVQTTRLANLWSGQDSEAVIFGQVASGTTLTVVALSDSRLLVVDSAGNYSYVALNAITPGTATNQGSDVTSGSSTSGTATSDMPTADTVSSSVAGATLQSSDGGASASGASSDSVAPEGTHKTSVAPEGEHKTDSKTDAGD